MALWWRSWRLMQRLEARLPFPALITRTQNDPRSAQTELTLMSRTKEPFWLLEMTPGSLKEHTLP